MSIVNPMTGQVFEAWDLPNETRLPDGRILHGKPWVGWNGLFGQIYTSANGLKSIVTRDTTPHDGPLWHLSASYSHRLPSWEDMRDLRNALLPPKLDFMLVLPRDGDYVNLHEYCLHIWQCPRGWNVL
jgi:hypothetical protein